MGDKARTFEELAAGEGPGRAMARSDSQLAACSSLIVGASSIAHPRARTRRASLPATGWLVERLCARMRRGRVANS
jgi:hypothetical protein